MGPPQCSLPILVCSWGAPACSPVPDTLQTQGVPLPGRPPEFTLALRPEPLPLREASGLAAFRARRWEETPPFWEAPPFWEGLGVWGSGPRFTSPRGDIRAPGPKSASPSPGTTTPAPGLLMGRHPRMPQALPAPLGDPPQRRRCPAGGCRGDLHRDLQHSPRPLASPGLSLSASVRRSGPRRRRLCAGRTRGAWAPAGPAPAPPRGPRAPDPAGRQDAAAPGQPAAPRRARPRSDTHAARRRTARAPPPPPAAAAAGRGAGRGRGRGTPLPEAAPPHQPPALLPQPSSGATGPAALPPTPLTCCGPARDPPPGLSPLVPAHQVPEQPRGPPTRHRP